MATFWSAVTASASSKGKNSRLPLVSRLCQGLLCTDLCLCIAGRKSRTTTPTSSSRETTPTDSTSSTRSSTSLVGKSPLTPFRLVLIYFFFAFTCGKSECVSPPPCRDIPLRLPGQLLLQMLQIQKVSEGRAVKDPVQGYVLSRD